MSSGILRLTQQWKIEGESASDDGDSKEKKSAQMNCTIIIDLPAKAIRDLQCN